MLAYYGSRISEHMTRTPEGFFAVAHNSLRYGQSFPAR